MENLPPNPSFWLPTLCLYLRVVDPDPHKFDLLDPYPVPHFEYGSGSRRAKMTYKYKKVRNFNFVKIFKIFGHQNLGSGSACWIRIRIKSMRTHPALSGLPLSLL
jgi:hypothetical protein